ncbi:hypothetical protein L0Y41_01950 [bacterium]|nr:hypothetical protein [bacterium]
MPILEDILTVLGLIILLILVGFGLYAFLGAYYGDAVNQIFRVFAYTAPYWLPIILGAMLWDTWVRYIRSRFIHTTPYTLLELKVPREVEKSPLAMEIVLSGLHNTSGESTWVKRSVQGKVRTWFSFEMVSIEGTVHYFIWTRTEFKNWVESHIYAQFPTIEIHEVPDYTKYVSYGYPGGEEWGLWGAEYKFTKPDCYPIRTYIDYGMDRGEIREREQYIDPLASVIEFLGSIRKDEQFWIQIMFRATKPSRKGIFFSKPTDWREEGQALVQKLAIPPDVENRRLTKGEMETINAIERSISKLGFDVGIRVMYISKTHAFRSQNIIGVMNIFKQFGSMDLNAFKFTRETDFDYPWQDFNGIRANIKKRKMIDAYRRRSYFHAPYSRTPIILNTEELATIFHFPSSAVTTPSFARIETKKSEPPFNLPR